MKILFIDIETAYMRAGLWGRFNQNIGMGQVLSTSYILNWAAKWEGDPYLHYDALHYHSLWKTEPTNDHIIVDSLREMVEEADLVVGHNVDKFDLKHLKARLLYHDRLPLSGLKTIDTLKLARRVFSLPSNKLGDISEFLGLSGKIDTGGFDLWKRIIEKQDKKAFDEMVSYCNQDVILLEELYQKLKPWNASQPIMGLGPLIGGCNSCGSTKLRKHGHYRTVNFLYQRYKCSDCGHTMRGEKGEKQGNLRSI